MQSNAQAGAAYYYERSGKKMGPLSPEQITSLVSKGGLSADTLVWRSGFANWTPLRETELAGYLPTRATLATPLGTPEPVRPTPAPALNPAPSTPPTVHELPAGVKGWCWGGFLLSWVWAIRFRVWWGLLALVPWVGFGMIIYLGLRGRELAWHRGTWSSVEAFNQTQRRWSIAGTVVVVVCLIGGGIYGFANGDAIDREVRTQKRAEDGASSRLTDQEILKGMAIALDASNAPAATDVPSLITVQGTEYQARGGTLVVQGDVTSGRKLLLNGQPVPKMTEDLMRLVSVYRYRDRDTALVTYGCGGSGCNWTWFALVEVLTNGQVNVMAGDKLQMDMDGSVPDIAIQSDGSLLVSFQAQQGREQWRYSKGQITKQ